MFNRRTIDETTSAISRCACVAVVPSCATATPAASDIAGILVVNIRMRLSSKLVESAASKSWITELIRPDPAGNEIGAAIAYRRTENSFLHGYECGVASVVFMRCQGAVERTRFGVLCYRSILARRPCCDATTQFFICVPDMMRPSRSNCAAGKPKTVFCQQQSDNVREQRPYVTLQFRARVEKVSHAGFRASVPWQQMANLIQPLTVTRAIGPRCDSDI